MLNCGIIGLPNVGKSTLFNALTEAGIAAANYPFCTIEPNFGIVPVPDSRLEHIAKLAHAKTRIPAYIQFVDIAGLVKGASRGAGLGNQFLSHVRNVHALIHVVRCFDHSDVTHVQGVVDPESDIDVIHTELILADLELVEKRLLKWNKLVRTDDKIASQHIALLERARAHLSNGSMLRTLALTQAQQRILSISQYVSAKPLLYVANILDAESVDHNLYVNQITQCAAQEQAPVIIMSAELESEIAQLEASEQGQFLASMDVTEPALNRLIRASYQLLGLQTFFTAGPKEVRAWTVPKAAFAPDAAAVIHSDFAKGFIRAEVIGYADYIQYQGEIGAKKAGKWHSEGKTYRVQDGDIILFRFQV